MSRIPVSSTKTVAPLTPVIVLMCTSILWGASWIPLQAFEKNGLQGLPLIFLSHIILALLISPRVFKIGVASKDIIPLSGIALLGGSAIVCFTCAMMYGDVIRVMTLFYLLPIWGVLGGRIFLKEHIDGWRWLGVGAALLGAFFILGAVNIFSSPPTWIDAIALLSGLCFAANNICFRGVERVPLSVKLGAMFYGTALITGGLMLAGIQAWPGMAVSETVWIYALIYTFSWILFANVGSQWAVTQMEAGRSSIIIIMELFAAIVTAILIGGEELNLTKSIGCALVVFAAFLEAKRSV